MNFTKVKHLKGSMVFEWEIDEGATGADKSEHRLTSYDDPHPDLIAAFRALVAPALKLLDLPSMYSRDLTVSGVSLTYEEKRGRGAVLTLQKKLDGCPAPLIFNTPYLPQDAGEHQPSLPSAMNDAINAVLVEAAAFLKGKRSQGDLWKAA
jgi:hypothetical protein